MKIYFGAPLFSEADFMYNEHVVNKIKNYWRIHLDNDPNDLEFYVPQEATEINDKFQYADSVMIAKFDTDELLSSDVMIALLDGGSMDAGVAAEIGIAFQAGIPVFGLYTDSRQQGTDNKAKIKALMNDVGENQFIYVNLFVVGLIKQNGALCTSIEELISKLELHKK